jgi:hypothetical protein
MHDGNGPAEVSDKLGQATRADRRFGEALFAGRQAEGFQQRWLLARIIVERRKI